MTARRRIGAAERRGRLVCRHHLGRSAPDTLTAVRAVVALHSSDPVTPHLALRARVEGFSVGDLERALYDDRSLWRLHAMRRTLFVVAAEDAPAVAAACAGGVARVERRRVERWVAEALGVDDPRPWLREVEEGALAALADGRPRSTKELAEQVEGLSLRVTVGSGRWAAATPLSSRLLLLLAMEGRIVRGRPAGSWLSSQYRWADARAWFAAAAGGWPEVLDDVPDAAEGRTRLARMWLRAHAPATAGDLQWWTGWTLRVTRAALAAVGAVEVELDGSQPGWVLPEDVDAAIAPPAAVALLPSLDPTVMGWKQRHWYLGDHARRLFDRNGNAGPTVWVDGRVVGGWAQRPDGEVVTAVLEDVGAEAGQRIASEAAALTAWLGGVVTTPRFRTPLERELAG